MTQTKVANDAKTHSCNLSAFIASKGEVRNLKAQLIVQILNETGLHETGVLTPGLHRWDLLTKVNEDKISVFRELVQANHADAQSHTPKVVLVDEAQCFFLHRVSNVTTLMAKLPVEEAPAVAKALGARIERAALNMSSELQSLWLTPHTWVVDRAIDTYLAAPAAQHT